MTPASESTFKLITPSNAAAKPTRFPLTVPTRGSTALQLQILLDRAGFSPGIIDATWGDNAAKALTWFNASASGDTTHPIGLADSSNRSVDRATYNRVAQAAGTTPLITSYTVTDDDVKGPFTRIPDRVYDQAKLDCLCYSSATEKIAERFHTNRELLAQLNPGVNFESISAGTTISVPNVGESETANSPSAPSDSNAGTSRDTTGSRSGGMRIVISKKEFWTHLVDSSGKVIRHFPSTLGAGYDPSPTGEFHVTGITRNPAFRYDPKLFAEIPDTRPTAKLRPGPNSPVGVVWIALSKPHYGIHGTAAPESIGYQSSHGCVRLTNWDATALADLISTGTPVTFQE
jgi:lipoprotein-anchoring transpeptidase ErfK/SrfK